MCDINYHILCVGLAGRRSERKQDKMKNQGEYKQQARYLSK